MERVFQTEEHEDNKKWTSENEVKTSMFSIDSVHLSSRWVDTYLLYSPVYSIFGFRHSVSLGSETV